MENGGYHSQKIKSGILHNPLTTLLFDMDNTLFDLVYAKTHGVRGGNGKDGCRERRRTLLVFSP